MKVIRLRNSGLCPGVANAFSAVSKALREGKVVAMAAPIAHNEALNKSLSQLGASTFAGNYNALLPGTIIAYGAHGLTREEEVAAIAADARILDTTCFFLQNISAIIDDQLKQGRRVALIGQRQHRETKSLASRKGIKIIETIEDIDGDYQVILCQSTVSQGLLEQLLPHFAAAQFIDTRCPHPRRYQEELSEYLNVADGVIIVCDRQSSNGSGLVAVAAKLYGEDHVLQVANKDQLDPTFLSRHQTLLIGSATSTPSEEIEKVVDYLKNYSK